MSPLFYMVVNGRSHYITVSVFSVCDSFTCLVSLSGCDPGAYRARARISTAPPLPRCEYATCVGAHAGTYTSYLQSSRMQRARCAARCTFAAARAHFSRAACAAGVRAAPRALRDARCQRWATPFATRSPFTACARCCWRVARCCRAFPRVVDDSRRAYLPRAPLTPFRALPIRQFSALSFAICHMAARRANTADVEFLLAVLQEGLVLSFVCRCGGRWAFTFSHLPSPRPATTVHCVPGTYLGGALVGCIPLVLIFCVHYLFYGFQAWSNSY